MMDDEFLKRSTDCVYFLASPLTCKKGIDCEYRHSEIARLNPRDCWYWLSGSCLNPGCAFRHPPLDAGTDKSTEANHSQNQTAPSSTKVNVPCYFFFNGTCNKGERCSFSHGPEDNPPARKTLKTPTAIDTISSQIRKNPETNSEQRHDNVQINSQQVAETQTHVLFPKKEDVRMLASPTNNFTFDITVERHEDNGGESMLELHPTAICVNQSTWDQQHIEGEDRLESSPGFDVLVDNGSEDGYEDRQEFILGLDHDGQELNGQYIGYDYEEEPIEYDPEYPHMNNTLREHEIQGSYHLQIHDQNEYATAGRRTRERLSEPIFTRKRMNFPTDNNTMDLRYHLENRKQNNGSPRQVIRRQNAQHPHQLSYENRIMSRKRQQQPTRRHKRRLSEEGMDLSNENGWYKRNKHKNNGRGDKGAENDNYNYVLSESSRTRGMGERFDLFTRPKTLAEIREEKEKVIGGRSTTTRTITHEDFEAPKPLSEILRDKNRLASVVESKESEGLPESG